MIGFLRGKVAEKQPTMVVIDVQGVGYDVMIPLSTYAHVPDIHHEVTLITYVHVREDAWQIFGFATKEERELFKQLISISGIGPKMGMTILSGIERAHFARAIVEKDSAPLTAISGIGKKTAERIIIELQGKIHLSESGPASAKERGMFDNRVLDDAVVALVSLGYTKADAQTALKKAQSVHPAAQKTVEDAVRHALQYM